MSTITAPKERPPATANGPVIGVLALQGDVAEYMHTLTRLGAHARPVRRPSALDDLDGLVIPGGESTTMSRLLDVFDLRQPVHRLLADGLPAFGSCAGMIMLATDIVDPASGQRPLAALDISVRRNAFGRQSESFEVDLAVAEVSGPAVRAVFIRAPWVERVGDQVQVLARVGDHPVAVRQGDVLATSFHPEIAGDLRLHERFLTLVRTRIAAVEQK